MGWINSGILSVVDTMLFSRKEMGTVNKDSEFESDLSENGEDTFFENDSMASDDESDVLSTSSGETFVENDSNSLDTGLDTDGTLVDLSGRLSLLSSELGVTEEELESLNYNELVVLGESINREYDAREKKVEDDLKEKININLQVLNEHVSENGVTEN